MDIPLACTDTLQESHALLALVLAGGSPAPGRRLLERHPGAAAALAAGPSAWQAAGCSPAQCAALQHPQGQRFQHGQDWLRADHHHLIGWQHPDYPPLLRNSPNPPLALFIDGDPSCLWHPAIAIVGSRSPSPGGCDIARDFTRALVAAGLAAGSGLADGIDAVSHHTALQAGAPRPFAVIGSGPDIRYPRRNAALQRQLAERGAVVSEYPPGTAPRRGHFPARNRILAGICLGTLVIEAAERSGALITARLAAEAGREVFAVPGSIHNPMSRGCHRLIREGVQLVSEPGQILETLSNLAATLGPALRKRLAAPTEQALPVAPPATALPDPDYQRLWNALGFDPTGMDSLIERTGLTAATVSSMLLVMELDGRVSAAHGRYVRTSGSFTSTASSDAGRGQ